MMRSSLQLLERFEELLINGTTAFWQIWQIFGNLNIHAKPRTVINLDVNTFNNNFTYPLRKSKKVESYIRAYLNKDQEEHAIYSNLS